MALRMPEMSIPARSNMPPLEPNSFCISTTMTAVLAGSTTIGPGLAASLSVPVMHFSSGGWLLLDVSVPFRLPIKRKAQPFM